MYLEMMIVAFSAHIMLFVCYRPCFLVLLIGHIVLYLSGTLFFLLRQTVFFIRNFIYSHLLPPIYWLGSPKALVCLFIVVELLGFTIISSPLLL